MKVLITSATGSSCLEALLDKDSGIVEFANGEISHVLYEKNFGKKIVIVKDAKKEPVKTEENTSTPTGQSKARPEKKTKTK